MKSLSRHLATSLAVSLICFFLVQSLLVGKEVRQLTEDGVLASLRDDMESILTSWAELTNINDVEQLPHVPEIFKRPFSGHYFQVIQNENIIRSRSLWDVEFVARTVGIHRGVQGPGQQQLLVLCEDYVVHGKPLVLCVAEDTSELEETTLFIQKRMLWLSFGALLILLLIQIWVIRHGLRPLSVVRKELKQLERGEIDKLKQAVPAEISPLVEEVNHLLIVLQQRLQRSRNAMGNLSHALKTPLTLIFQILERRENDKDTNQLLTQARQIEDHINRELSRARTAGQFHGGHWPHPDRDVRDLVATLTAVYQHQISIALNIQEIASLPTDREDMMEMLGNLIDNACKWANSQVSVQIYEDAGLHIIIEDDGPGMQEEEREKVLGRGIRLDETKQGHGLGLSIVRDIVGAYHGKFELDSSQWGGLKVKINLQLQHISAD